MRALALFVFLLPACLWGKWTLIRSFNQPVSCGYFLNPDQGLIGTCSNLGIGQPQIWRTTDGGSTWRQAFTPIVTEARLTSIFMKNSLTGYASLWQFDGNVGLWKTNDGGLTWYDHTKGNNLSATCVYATPYSLVFTSWPQINRGLVGGFSLDDGNTMQMAFESSFTDESNGIAFTDDLHGVVTPGPQRASDDEKSNCFFTEDGGVTWQQGGLISESWGIYGQKGTKTFFALPEGLSLDPQTTLVTSTDVGRSWRTLYSFSSTLQFTGHIDGMGRTLYVQTNEESGNGLFRSDDLGKTWKNVGGPSNERDTRFVVTGCNGAIVYAFDWEGNVWKTTDGGDGTLMALSSDLYVQFDSLRFSTSCDPVKRWLPVNLNSCLDSVTIEQYSIENDPTGQFSIDTIAGPLAFELGAPFRLPIVYTAGKNGTQSATVRIRARAGNVTIDTTIALLGTTQRPTAVTLGIDSLLFSTVCTDVRDWIPVSFGSCDDSVVIDELLVEGDASGQFTIDTIDRGLLIPVPGSLRIPVRYTPGALGTQTARIRIRAHASDITIDTVIEATGITMNVPDPYTGIDSLLLSTICTDVREWIPAILRSCDDSVVIDAILIENDAGNYFTIDTIAAGFTVAAGAELQIPVIYRCGDPGVRNARVRIIAHSRNITIDTVIELTGITIKLPEPYTPDIARGRAGDTVRIPIYLDRTTDAFSITEYELKMNFNTDLLEAIAFDSMGTLTRNISSYTFTPRPEGVYCKFVLGSPITHHGDLSLPLLEILARIYLTTEASTTVTIDSFNVFSGVFKSSLLGCSERSSAFTITYVCGDSILSAFMRTGKVSITNIRPNPGTTFVEMDVTLPEGAVVTVEAVDMTGIVRHSADIVLYQGMSTIRIETDELASGVYSLLLRTPFGNAAKSVVIGR